MRFGLANRAKTVPMIPTYLRFGGTIPEGAAVIVIDAGGTKLRRAVVTFEGGGCVVSDLQRAGMPGVGSPVTWREFVSRVADSLMPVIDRSDEIGFCFSYAADTTPDRDAIAHPLTKEVTVTEIEGQLVGASLLAELERRGVRGKRVTVLNDTPAVLLGTGALTDTAPYDSLIGLVCGTGMNACCILPHREIPKLGLTDAGSMIVSLEIATFTDVPRGDLDILLDRESAAPGHSLLEKMTAGVYLGELLRLVLRAAAEEGDLSAETVEKAEKPGQIDAAVMDAWAAGEGLENLCADAEEAAFIRGVCLELFRRAALGVCAAILAILKLTGKGTEKPVLICAEGSLVQKGRHFRPMLETFLREFAENGMGRKTVLAVGEETTLPGSAAAAILHPAEQ